MLQIDSAEVENVECGMESDPKYNEQERSRAESRNIDDTYIFDPATGIYKPKTIETDQQRTRKEAGTNPNARFFTDPRTDWRPVIVASLISVGTLALLIATVRYARLQWVEMAKTYKKIEEQTKMMHQQLVGTQAAVVQGDATSNKLTIQL